MRRTFINGQMGRGAMWGVMNRLFFLPDKFDSIWSIRWPTERKIFGVRQQWAIQVGTTRVFVFIRSESLLFEPTFSVPCVVEWSTNGSCGNVSHTFGKAVPRADRREWDSQHPRRPFWPKPDDAYISTRNGISCFLRIFKCKGVSELIMDFWARGLLGSIANNPSPPPSNRSIASMH